MDIVVLLGLLGIAADIGIRGERRAALPSRVSAVWSCIAKSAYGEILSRGNETAWRIAGYVLGGRRGLLRVCLATVCLSALVGLASLAIATIVIDTSWRDALDRTLRYYAAPMLLAGVCALALVYLHIRGVRNTGSPWRVAARLVSLAAALLALWVAAMHAGTWHEWQYRRSAVGYGTPWFYAEVYHEYLVGGVGAAVSLALALTLLMPAAAYALFLLVMVVLKAAAPVLAPASTHAAAWLARRRRGAPSLIIFLILAAMLALARRPWMDAGPLSLLSIGARSVVVVHVGPWIGNEPVSVRHLHLR